MNRKITQRQEYHVAELSKKSLRRNPLKQFHEWYEAAEKKKIHTPNAAVLSTSGKKNKPSARVVLIKAFHQNGFEFYTHYQSAKARDLAENPKAELVFYWAELERQVRIYGAVKKLSAKKSEAYFSTRPRGAQLAAWTSLQSKIVDSRQILLRRKSALETRFCDKKIPLPPNWGGYILQPKAYEFWQGRPDRLNDRYLYKKFIGKSQTSPIWKIDCLQP